MQDVKNGPSVMAKSSLILGICAIIPLPFVNSALGLAAIILGIIDLVKINKGEASDKGKKFDIIGIVLGVVLPIISWSIISAIGVAIAGLSGILGL
ncbi:hypothetical protein ES705_02189 [subsurface metagenome]|nr:hypothetical protein [Clostridia bacterium]TET14537.1 MAG: hypothetical protein E3J77_04380 [Actinomycetota bacterium]